MLKKGLYEEVISEGLNAELSSAADMHCETVKIDCAESPKILAKYVAEIVERGLENISDSDGGISKQIDLINKIVSAIASETKEDSFDASTVAKRAEQLLAFYEQKDNVYAINGRGNATRPETSISQSSLFTGAAYEPQMFSELKKEILSCDRIDMLVSFIKWSGLRLIIDDLCKFTRNGGTLRVITTSYMGATDIKAVEELSRLLNTRLKVSYDTKRTRLHAKTYVFYRDTGFTTAYIGSSNLSGAAISSGLEWNVKITRKDLPETIDKIAATFESYWSSKDFEYYDEGQRERLERALQAEHNFSAGDRGTFFDITPYSYQQEILDKLEAERTVRGNFRNLVVAATGTGKTVISAFDYKRFRTQNPSSPCRLLFIAHREEILKQSLCTFQGILKDNNFGELFVGNYVPASIDDLFMSIQTFNSRDFTEKTSPTFYDYIIIDEFHHAAAPTYAKLLDYYKPKILLGLTATPERMDSKDILRRFGGRIAAEIRLPEAIERELLSPFQYFGVSDSTDLENVKWVRGGYDKAELSRLYTLSGAAAERRASMICASLMQYVTDINEVKGLGFCVSVEHAKFMSDYFCKYGIESISLTGESSEEDRGNAKNLLMSGKIRFIFVVDIYNEGVDIPDINTVLFLRPTESLTIFLQQLGRGLRLADGKECLTVLDFIGQANRRYNFEEKFAALLSNTSKGVQHEIHNGFVSVPKGCFIQLEKMAREYILNNIHASFGVASGIVQRISTFTEDSGLELNLANFADYYHLDPRTIYAHGSFSRLCVLAGRRDDFNELHEEVLTKALVRFACVDSRRFIKFVTDILTKGARDFTEAEKRMVNMFQFTVWQKPFSECGYACAANMIDDIRRSPVMCGELIELLQYNYGRIDFIDEPVYIGFDCPLDLHCAYSRDQILVAMDFLKPASVREGVKFLHDKKLDLFFVTLNKSDKDYSPTTMYRDYSINEALFHWQSQSTTAADSATGQRYIHHRERGSRILLFVREFKTDRISGGAGTYTYLGTANYVEHTGSRPMNITWRLDRPIPARFLRKTNKLAAC